MVASPVCSRVGDTEFVLDEVWVDAVRVDAAWGGGHLCWGP